MNCGGGFKRRSESGRSPADDREIVTSSSKSEKSAFDLGFEVPKLGAILSDSKGPTNPLPVFLDVFWLRSSVPFNREI
jgi:hypothetical protein